MIILHVWYCCLRILILSIDILGVCYYNILLFANTLQFTFQLKFTLNISTFSGHLLSRILHFYGITDLIFWICSLASSFLIILISSDEISFIYPFIFCTLKTAMFFSEDMVLASTLKYATLLLISFSSSVRQYISCF